MKQTAVEWLVSEISRDRVGQAIIKTFLEEFDQAKEIEKQQIIDAYERGDKYKSEPPGTDYYKETFNK